MIDTSPTSEIIIIIIINIIIIIIKLFTVGIIYSGKLIQTNYSQLILQKLKGDKKTLLLFIYSLLLFFV